MFVSARHREHGAIRYITQSVFGAPDRITVLSKKVPNAIQNKNLLANVDAFLTNDIHPCNRRLLSVAANLLPAGFKVSTESPPH